MQLDAFLDYLAEDRRSRDLAKKLEALVVLRFGLDRRSARPAPTLKQQAS